MDPELTQIDVRSPALFLTSAAVMCLNGEAAVVDIRPLHIELRLSLRQVPPHVLSLRLCTEHATFVLVKAGTAVPNLGFGI